MKQRLAPPSSAAWKALGPYARGKLQLRALGQSLTLEVPHDVFASQAIDDGTLLLLEHLPAGEPKSVLDLGCGYGALGLPIAARFPDARCLLVDRDLLAVAASAHNAAALGLANALAQPGLGYRGLGKERFDWALCNVPARIGPAAIRYLLAGGAQLAEEVRVVVIRDLAPVVEGLALPGLAHVARGPRHDIFSLPSAARAGAESAENRVRSAAAAAGIAAENRVRDVAENRVRDVAENRVRDAAENRVRDVAENRVRDVAVALDDESIYARDETRIAGLTLSRPHDASEDPRHAEHLALLFEALPKAPPRNALVFRAGYGPLPLALKARHSTCAVRAQERDLLDAAFLRRNAEALALPVEVRETLFPREAGEPDRFALVCGELSPAAGAQVAAREVAEAQALLAPGGEALILLSEKQEREWLPALPRGTVLLRRSGASVLRLTQPRR